ncbi:ABC transporter substrate-binding protein, partial [Armatimonas sp.]|uniref:ABC transporter substrate-binding protein n=1 Tax=Armatimonas sp. TaxID=1872638 RepID=UPI00375315CE
MQRSHFLGLAAALLLAGCTPKVPQGGTSAPRETLEVGFLPVTCHLTCPVTAFASETSTSGTRFESRRFTDWPTVADALRTGALKATFMIAPMAMKLKADGVPCKIVYL